MPNEYSSQELMAIVLARDLKDGEVLRVGVAMPVVEAAVRGSPDARAEHGVDLSRGAMNVAHSTAYQCSPSAGIGG
jgi:hypothetical protein